MPRGYAWPNEKILRESSLFSVASNSRQDETVGVLHYFIMLLNTKALNMSMPIMVTTLMATAVFMDGFVTVLNGKHTHEIPRDPLQCRNWN